MGRWGVCARAIYVYLLTFFAAKLLTKHTQLTFPRAVTPSLSLLTLRQKEKGLFHDETCGEMGYPNHMSEPFVNPPMLGEGQN